MQRQTLLLERFCSYNVGSPVCGEHTPWLLFKLCLLYKANFTTGNQAGNPTLTLLAPPACTFTHEHTPSQSGHGEAIISTSWRTQCSQVTIHLPDQVTGWLRLMTITAAGMRGSRVLPMSRVCRKNNEGDGASFISALQCQCYGFRQKCHRKPATAVHWKAIHAA